MKTKNFPCAMWRYYIFALFVPVLLVLTVTNPQEASAAVARRGNANTPLGNDPSNIHAIIVSSSRYWFNYRHAINALGMYEIYRQNGIPDENIILMIADEFAVNARNPYKNRMHADGIHRTGWYNNRTEIDYRGSDVTVQMFMDALLGEAPKSLQNLNAESKLMIYITGHGGDQFFKFQDEEELMAQDIANLMDKLYEEKKFGTALFIADTCQAFTLFDKVTTPNIMALGTSLIDESAYAHHTDNNLGLAIIERWTYHFLDFYNKRSNPRTTLHDSMVAPFLNKNVLMARVGIKDDTSYRKFEDTKLSEFFGIRRGRKPLKKAMTKQAYPVVEVSPENLLTLPQRARPASATGSIKPQREIAPAKESTSKTCVVEEDDNLIEFSMNSCYILLFGFVVALQVTKKCEKLFFSWNN
mmetsp:Transcript_5226/g.10881  ORF Transcript_5226/g.10881 Transcript_5226/m.10881 type:complete len:414 (+) Transcript_5226:1-1242(+)